MSHTNDVTPIENSGWDERILVFANGKLVNTFIVVTERRVVIIDTMINEATGRKLLAAAEPYLNSQRTLLVVNTHADYDHAWGNQVFGGDNPAHRAPIIAHQASLAQFRDPKVLSFAAELRTKEPETFETLTIVEPTLLFDRHMIIEGGDLTLHLLHMPGHTDDHLVIHIPEIDTLIAADGAEPPFPYARTPKGLQPMRDSLQAMADLNCATVLYCHAPVQTGPQLIHDNIAYFDAIEAACRSAAARGVKVAELAAEADALISAIGCRYEDVVTERPTWHEIHENYRTKGHAHQLKMMLLYLEATQVK